MQSSNKKTVNKVKQKQTVLLEEAQKLQQNIRKKKTNIQKKYNKSAVNQLYIFPRILYNSNVQSQQSSSEQEIQLTYNLKSQNVKSKNNQTKTFINILQEGAKAKQYYSVKSNQSIHSVQEGGKTLKNKSRKSKNIEISFNTKKKTPSHTKNNSQRKLFAEQYSLQNRIYATSKQNNNNRLVVSFRGNKKHQINISLSGRRMKTQIN